MMFLVVISLCVASSLAKPGIGYSYYPHALPVVTASGYLADTPEVSAAKAAHFAEHAKRGNYHLSPYSAAYSAVPYSAASYSIPSTYHTPNIYHNHYTTPVVTASGFLADTPEVAAAKTAHFTEKARVSALHYNAIPLAHQNHQLYPFVSSTGHIADTPEVSAAKAAHFAEHAAAVARNAAVAHTDLVGYSAYSAWPAIPTNHYAATPVVTPTGHLADTPEVAHAKAAHLAEYAAIASRQKRSVSGLTPASTVPLSSVLPYSAPLLHISHTPLSYPYSTYLPADPLIQPITHSAVIHGPHAVSYQVSN